MIITPEEHEKIGWPLQRLPATENPLLDCDWDLPVDDKNWMSPLLGLDTIHLNQDFSAYHKVTGSDNPHSRPAKLFMKHYILETPEKTEHFFTTYKSILDLDLDDHTVNKRKHIPTEFEDVHTKLYYTVNRIHRFMARAVSYLVSQHHHDIVKKIGAEDATNLFQVLRYEKKSEIVNGVLDVNKRDQPLTDMQLLNTLLDAKEKKFTKYSFSELEKKTKEIYAETQKPGRGNVEQLLLAQQNRQYLYEMYRYSSVYYKYQPNLFLNTMENMPMFWQLYAEMNGKVVTVTDHGITKWFAPFRFDVALVNYLSKHTNEEENGMLYSTEKLSSCPLGVESLLTYCLAGNLVEVKDPEYAKVFSAYITEISLESLTMEDNSLIEDNDESNLYLRRKID